MYLPIEKIQEQSRIWIYQSNRLLNDDEVNSISKALEDFISGWDSHGSPLTGSFKVYYNRFIIISVDDHINAPSGCSIDKSVAIIKEIEKHFNISLFDRTQIAFWSQDKIEIISLQEIKNAIEEGKLGTDTVIFNNTINSLKELENNWQILAKDSWMKRYFKRQTV